MPQTLPEPTIDSFDLKVALHHTPEPIDCVVLVEEAALGLGGATFRSGRTPDERFVDRFPALSFRLEPYVPEAR